jgi:tRNA U34 5-carboxymethylaminomethyl modifying GTPase MnmE/TrmE
LRMLIEAALDFPEDEIDNLRHCKLKKDWIILIHYLSKYSSSEEARREALNLFS